MRRLAEMRPLFHDNPQKYIGMDPMRACQELGITLVQLVQLIDAEEDIFPNPRPRPVFEDDPVKYIGMNPMDACHQLGITLAQLTELINTVEDIFPNPRNKLVEKEKKPKTRASRIPVTMGMPPAFKNEKLGEASSKKNGGSQGGYTMKGQKIGQNGQNAGASKVSDPATASHFCPFFLHRIFL